MAAKIEEMQEAAVTIWPTDNCTHLYRGDKLKRITPKNVSRYCRNLLITRLLLMLSEGLLELQKMAGSSIDLCVWECRKGLVQGRRWRSSDGTDDPSENILSDRNSVLRSPMWVRRSWGVHQGQLVLVLDFGFDETLADHRRCTSVYKLYDSSMAIIIIVC